MFVSTFIEYQKRSVHLTKGELKSLRSQGWVPGIVYGDNKEPVGVSIKALPFLKELQTPGVKARVFDLGEIGLVLVKDMQFLPIKDTPIHLDFVRLKEHVVVSVPVKLIHEDLSPGIKRGGVCNVVHFSLEISVPSKSIPQSIEVNMEGIEIGQSLHLKDIVLPQGAKALHIHDEDTIVSVVAPSGLTESLKG